MRTLGSLWSVVPARALRLFTRSSCKPLTCGMLEPVTRIELACPAWESPVGRRLNQSCAPSGCRGSPLPTPRIRQLLSACGPNPCLQTRRPARRAGSSKCGTVCGSRGRVSIRAFQVVGPVPNHSLRSECRDKSMPKSGGPAAGNNSRILSRTRFEFASTSLPVNPRYSLTSPTGWS
jgi:hypothetical protein